MLGSMSSAPGEAMVPRVQAVLWALPWSLLSHACGLGSHVAGVNPPADVMGC